MKYTRTELTARYLAGLGIHLDHKTSNGSDHAQGLGRSALAGGLKTRDLAAIHARAVFNLASSHDFANPRIIRRAAHFFAQTLIPVEAALRATRQNNRHLSRRNETLRRHALALARGNRRLTREITRREAGEAAIKKAKDKYRSLLLESQVMQHKLRHLTRQIISTQEEERKKISRELHDGVVQTLVGINVELAALCKGTAVGVLTIKQKIARTRRLVEHSVRAVHRFARELRPAVLDDLGLIPALHSYSKQLAARKKFRIEMTVYAGVELLSNTTRTVLFRVAQEALNNVARHAHATQVALNICKSAGAICMEISDNGKSFNVRKTLLAQNNKRLGLIGMQERIQMIGGRLTIESVPATGTTVRAEIPFQLKTRPSRS